MRIVTLCVLSILMVPVARTQDRQEFTVRYLVPPIYPAVASTAKLQGTVRIKVEVSADGKVISAHASGASPILNQASQENIVQWVFSRRAATWEFTILYVYKLQGEESYRPRNTRILLDLPDRIEITGQPLKPNT